MRSDSDFRLETEGTAVVRRNVNVMDTKQKNLFILVACTAVYGSIAFFFLVFCCRILLKCKSEKRIQKEESEKKSHITSFSEISASVRIDEAKKIPKINAGHLVEISVEDNATASKTFSDVDRKEQGQVWQQLTFGNRENERQDMFIDKQGSHAAA